MINEIAISLEKRTSRSPGLQKSRSLFEILIAFLPIIVFGFIGTRIGTSTFLGGMIVTLGYVASILIATVILKIRGSGWRQIGMVRPQSWKRTILLGIGVLVALLVMNIALQVIALNLPGAEVQPIDQSRFNPLNGNLAVFLLFVGLAWTTIAFGEEMFYRAFLITQLEDALPGSKLGTALVLLFSSTIFGLVHWVEGPLGVINTFAMGLILGIVYLRSGRNLWITIIAHGLANTIRFVFLFLGAV
jgi:membrane protease YdiL (CAAX protease family)